MDLNQEYRFDVERRLNSVIWIVGVFFLIVVLRLFYLQLVKGDYYFAFSANNVIRNIKIPAPRGLIYDKNNNILAMNEPAYDLIVIPQYITDKDLLIESLVKFGNLDYDFIKERIETAVKGPPYRPFTVVENIDYDFVVKIKSVKLPFTNPAFNLDGIDVTYRYIRNYPDSESLSHILGYVREIDAKKLKSLSRRFPGKYRKGDFVGISGVESIFDHVVRGRDGETQKVVNALGREISYDTSALELSNEKAVAGADLYLTVNQTLQQKARLLMEGKEGAVVALDPDTGSILLLYSSPSYDLSRLQSSERNEYWHHLITSEKRPLFNRSIQGIYPPASTYKIVTAIASLEEGIVNKSEEVTCSGAMKYGNRFFNCWLASGHGSVNVVDALEGSCDIFFYQMGLRLGVDRLAGYAKKMGMGRKTGIELRGEKSGLVPTKKWKKEKRGKEWLKSEVLSVAIGQGYNLATPIQIARLGAIIANGGRNIRPYIVDKIASKDGRSIYERKVNYTDIDGISKKSIELIKRGMVKVVEGDGGTAKNLRKYDINIAGKTGTAQVVGRNNKSDEKFFKNHAWFVGFAPYDNPEIAVAVLVEHGGHGSSAAAPIAGEIMDEYLNELEMMKDIMEGWFFNL